MNSTLVTLKERGFIAQCSDTEALSALMDSGGMTFYVGCDPTGASLHIGHIVPFFAFRHLREAGHCGIALIGGGTARIGDPSGKTEMRKMLSYEQLDSNAASIREQLSRFLGGFDGKTAICANNKDWLAGLNYIDFLRDIGRHFSVNRMLSFEAYKLRMETGLSFIEFNYQLLQSYDFLELYRRYGCRLQIGGDDQWGNIIAGMELIRRVEGKSSHNEETAFALTFPLVTTSDGKKMGKTEKGAIFLDASLTSPYDFFQYWRNTQDADLKRFLLMFTFLPVTECESLCAAGKNPNEAKERLAWELTALIHGKDEADKALSGARAAFGGGAADRSNMPFKKFPASCFEKGCCIIDLFTDAGLCATKSEARRLAQQGGAFLMRADGDFTAIDDVKSLITLDNFINNELILRAGKKHFCRITLE
ncbi:MAG: tyrosine--tRNA ligase [Spirochaetaceae bacterium]|jgi:tyrosyl-tRNA synthetase|nr:tyrosine--tRNA ligase [Spirochaetaceae bacterium]